MQVTVHRVRSITSEITHYTDPPEFFVRNLTITSEDGSYELKLMASSHDSLMMPGDQQQVVKYEPKRDERTWIERGDVATPAPDDDDYDDDIDNDPDDDDDDIDIGEPVGSTAAS